MFSIFRLWHSDKLGTVVSLQFYTLMFYRSYRFLKNSYKLYMELFDRFIIFNFFNAINGALIYLKSILRTFKFLTYYKLTFSNENPGNSFTLKN